MGSSRTVFPVTAGLALPPSAQHVAGALGARVWLEHRHLLVRSPPLLEPRRPVRGEGADDGHAACEFSSPAPPIHPVCFSCHYLCSIERRGRSQDVFRPYKAEQDEWVSHRSKFMVKDIRNLANIGIFSGRTPEEMER